MSRVSDAAKSVQTFTGEVRTELKKSSWPTRQELVGSTIVIIISVVMLGAFVYVSDTFLSNVIRHIVR